MGSAVDMQWLLRPGLRGPKREKCIMALAGPSVAQSCFGPMNKKLFPSILELFPKRALRRRRTSRVGEVRDCRLAMYLGLHRFGGGRGVACSWRGLDVWRYFYAGPGYAEIFIFEWTASIGKRFRQQCRSFTVLVAVRHPWGAMGRRILGEPFVPFMVLVCRRCFLTVMTVMSPGIGAPARGQGLHPPRRKSRPSASAGWSPRELIVRGTSPHVARKMPASPQVHHGRATQMPRPVRGTHMPRPVPSSVHAKNQEEVPTPVSQLLLQPITAYRLHRFFRNPAKIAAME